MYKYICTQCKQPRRQGKNGNKNISNCCGADLVISNLAMTALPRGRIPRHDAEKPKPRRTRTYTMKEHYFADYECLAYFLIGVLREHTHYTVTEDNGRIVLTESQKARATLWAGQSSLITAFLPQQKRRSTKKP